MPKYSSPIRLIVYDRHRPLVNWLAVIVVQSAFALIELSVLGSFIALVIVVGAAIAGV